MNVTLQSGIVQAATGTVLGLVGARLAGQAYAIGAGIGATVELGAILAGRILPREYQDTFQSVCSFTASAVGAHIYGRLANTPIKTAHILLFAGGYTLVDDHNKIFFRALPTICIFRLRERNQATKNTRSLPHNLHRQAHEKKASHQKYPPLPQISTFQPKRRRRASRRADSSVGPLSQIYRLEYRVNRRYFRSP